MPKLKIILLLLVFGLIFLIGACDEQSQPKKKVATTVVAGKISQPVIQKKVKKEDTKDAANSKKTQIAKAETGQQVLPQKADDEKGEHYDSKGKTDPFKPLIQDKPEESRPVVVDKRPKRILTPLEKIELSQIRLVAVIIMENKQIAMVEEASGKGYEVGIGTYIGRNQGRVSEILSSSIVVKELVYDFKGRLKERVQEIKLHKIDNEG